MAKARKSLNKLETNFVDEYLLTLNAFDAAKKAGYALSTAKARSSEWIGKTRKKCPENKRHVWDEVQRRIKLRSEGAKVDADWVLKRLTAEAEADMADLYDDEGNIKSIHQWPMVWRQGLVSGMEVQSLMKGDDATGKIVKLRISERIKRLELIGKHVNVKAFEGDEEDSREIHIHISSKQAKL